MRRRTSSCKACPTSIKSLSHQTQLNSPIGPPNPTILITGYHGQISTHRNSCNACPHCTITCTITLNLQIATLAHQTQLTSCPQPILGQSAAVYFIKQLQCLSSLHVGTLTHSPPLAHLRIFLPVLLALFRTPGCSSFVSPCSPSERLTAVATDKGPGRTDWFFSASSSSSELSDTCIDV